MINHIKIERSKNDLTQQDLADRVGVSRQTINAIEKNKFNPSTLLALKIAKVFSVSVNDIFFLEQDD
ncbi:MAG: helix-turn-helix transcriptional regulator [Bacteroidales bacterium]|nr:helix-turn-helix transcriptional regulator [Bacteroidales bacterium]MBP5382094.1 helix-turn-helix transcriptional regulator [Bacteroidales bacterium]